MDVTAQHPLLPGRRARHSRALPPPLHRQHGQQHRGRMKHTTTKPCWLPAALPSPVHSVTVVTRLPRAPEGLPCPAPDPTVPWLFTALQAHPKNGSCELLYERFSFKQTIYMFTLKIKNKKLTIFLLLIIEGQFITWA